MASTPPQHRENNLQPAEEYLWDIVRPHWENQLLAACNQQLAFLVNLKIRNNLRNNSQANLHNNPQANEAAYRPSQVVSLWITGTDAALHKQFLRIGEHMDKTPLKTAEMLYPVFAKCTNTTSEYHPALLSPADLHKLFTQMKESLHNYDFITNRSEEYWEAVLDCLIAKCLQNEQLADTTPYALHNALPELVIQIQHYMAHMHEALEQHNANALPASAHNQDNPVFNVLRNHLLLIQRILDRAEHQEFAPYLHIAIADILMSGVNNEFQRDIQDILTPEQLAQATKHRENGLSAAMLYAVSQRFVDRDTPLHAEEIQQHNERNDNHNKQISYMVAQKRALIEYFMQQAHENSDLDPETAYSNTIQLLATAHRWLYQQRKYLNGAIRRAIMIELSERALQAYDNLDFDLLLNQTMNHENGREILEYLDAYYFHPMQIDNDRYQQFAAARARLDHRQESQSIPDSSVENSANPLLADNSGELQDNDAELQDTSHTAPQFEFAICRAAIAEATSLQATHRTLLLNHYPATITEQQLDKEVCTSLVRALRKARIEMLKQRGQLDNLAIHQLATLAGKLIGIYVNLISVEHYPYTINCGALFTELSYRQECSDENSSIESIISLYLDAIDENNPHYELQQKFTAIQQEQLHANQIQQDIQHNNDSAADTDNPDNHNLDNHTHHDNNNRSNQNMQDINDLENGLLQQQADQEGSEEGSHISDDDIDDENDGDPAEDDGQIAQAAPPQPLPQQEPHDPLPPLDVIARANQDIAAFLRDPNASPDEIMERFKNTLFDARRQIANQQNQQDELSPQNKLALQELVGQIMASYHNSQPNVPDLLYTVILNIQVEVQNNEEAQHNREYRDVLEAIDRYFTTKDENDPLKRQYARIGRRDHLQAEPRPSSEEGGVQQQVDNQPPRPLLPSQQQGRARVQNPQQQPRRQQPRNAGKQGSTWTIAIAIGTVALLLAAIAAFIFMYRNDRPIAKLFN